MRYVTRSGNISTFILYMRHLFLLVAFSFLAFAGQAQTQRPTSEQRAQAMTTAMMQHLKLSGAQAKKIQEINLNSIYMVERAKRDLKGDPAKLKVTVDQISSSRLSSIKEVLTPTQFTQFNAHRERKMGLSDGGPAGGMGRRAQAEEYSN